VSVAVPHPDRPRISVIVPVYNDRDVLPTCLAALARQTLPTSEFEVLVVDNASTEPLGDLSARFPTVRFESESKPGSYAARNRGISASRGEMIAFTDADCIPRADWLECGVRRLEANRTLGLVGGAIQVFPRDPQHLTPTEVYEKGCALIQDVYVGVFKFAATANLFTFRSVLDDVGWFDAELKAGGDWEWGMRVSAKYAVELGDDVVVTHPARHTFRERARKARRTAGGLYGVTQSAAVAPAVWQMAPDHVPPRQPARARDRPRRGGRAAGRHLGGDLSNRARWNAASRMSCLPWE